MRVGYANGIASRISPPGPPSRYTNGVCSSLPDVGGNIATASTTFPPPGSDRSSGTVTVPHTGDVPAGSSKGHGPYSIVGSASMVTPSVEGGVADVVVTIRDVAGDAAIVVADVVTSVDEDSSEAEQP